MGIVSNPLMTAAIASSLRVPTAVRCDAPSDYAEWAAFTGMAPDYVHAFANATSWDNVVTAVKAAIAAFPTTKLVWAFPLATGSQGNPAPTQTTTPAQVTAGTYDTYINYCLDLMLAHNPSGPIYIRPGWEAGIFTSWPWSATSNIANARVDYIAAFQKVSNLIRAKSSRFVISWCVANYCQDYAGTVVNPTDAATGFDPGAAYYDAVGIDAYLIGVDISNAQTFDSVSHTRTPAQLLVTDVQYGLRYLADFARTNAKSMTIDEWAVGADRPDYIRDMAAFLSDPRNRVLYHGYWNKNAGTQVSGQYPFPCRLSDNSNSYPFTKAEYLARFHGKGTPTSEQAETGALISRSTTTTTAARRAALDVLYVSLKSGGLMPYLDGLFVLSAADNTISLINLVGGGGFTTTVPRSTGRMAITGAPVFTADHGFTGTGSTADFMRGTGVNLSNAAGIKFSQNDAHLGALMLTANSNAGAQTYETGVASSFIGGAAAGNRWVGRPNTAGTVTISAAAQGVGHIMWNRTASNAWASYFNGVQSQTGIDASAAPTNDDLRICSIPGLGAGVNQIAIVHFGKSLPASTPFNGPLTLYNALYAYAHGIGAI